MPFRTEICSRKVEIGSVFAIAFLASTCIFMPGIATGHDIFFHLLRIDGIAEELRRGNFPVRLQSIWLDGYGYPVSIFYGDALLYFPALLRLVGIPLTTAYKIYILCINAATAVVSYMCFRRIFKDKIAGLLLSLVYTAAPYRLVDIFVRSAVGEYSSFLFFPVIALSMHRIYFGPPKILRNAIILSVSMSLLLLTHILSLEMTLIVLLIFAAFFWKKTFSKPVFLTLCTAVLLSLCLCAFFIVPLVDYTLNVPVNVTKITEKHIQDGGVYVSQILAFFQNPFGADSREVRDRMIFSPGLPLVSAFVFSVIFLLYVRKDRHLFLLVIFSALAFFLSSNSFPYNTLAPTKIGRILSQIQFPWRWLSFVTIFLTLTLGRLIKMKELDRISVRAGIVFMAILQVFAFSSMVLDKSANYYAKDWTAFGSDQVSGQEYVRR